MLQQVLEERIGTSTFSRRLSSNPAKAAVFGEIDRRNKHLDKGKVTHLYRPDKDKENLKDAVDLQENDELYHQAVNIYEKYTAIAKENYNKIKP